MNSILLKILLGKLCFPPSSHRKNGARSILAKREITILPAVCLLFSVGFSEGDTQTPWWDPRAVTQGSQSIGDQIPPQTAYSS